jgi:hypothetical protein
MQNSKCKTESRAVFEFSILHFEFRSASGESDIHHPPVLTVVSLDSIIVDGTGMCGGCRVLVNNKSQFACVDGPELDAHHVDFGGDAPPVGSGPEDLESFETGFGKHRVMPAQFPRSRSG